MSLWFVVRSSWFLKKINDSSETMNFELKTPKLQTTIELSIIQKRLIEKHIF